MDFVCKQCGKTFQDKPSKHRLYCSKECHDKAQQGLKIQTVCVVCGSSIEIRPSARGAVHTCSPECLASFRRQHLRQKVNIPGHTKGHRAPHLSELNKSRNPMLALESDAVNRHSYKTKEHRKVMEQILGRKLKPSEDVHHINGIHDDNRPENLMVIEHREHLKLHRQIAKDKGVI